MSTPRTSGPPPSDSPEKKMIEKKRIEEVEKIEKVAEAENERRARKFRAMFEEPPASVSSSPSLLDVVSADQSSTKASSSNFQGMDEINQTRENIGRTVVPDPAYSPPPSLSSAGPFFETQELESALPQAQQFWNEVDEPPDVPFNPPRLQETLPSSARELAQARPEKTDEEEISPSVNRPRDQEQDRSVRGPKGKPQGKSRSHHLADAELCLKSEVERFDEKKPAGKRDSSDARGQMKELSEEEKSFGSVFQEILVDSTSKEKMARPQDRKSSNEDRQAALKSEQIHLMARGKEEKPEISPQPGFSKKPLDQSRQPEMDDSAKRVQPGNLLGQIQSERRKGDEGGKRAKVEPIPIQSPTISPLPEAVVPAAQAAASAAAPYLSPEVLAMYFHIVGTITAMVSSSGDVHTEFVLNSPSFADSKFFGATISIDRFSTAPAALNIRLTGSNEAVSAFNQNLPNLLAAFEQGRFHFKINRIDTELETSPYLFRRKGKEEGGFGGGKAR